MSETTSGFKVKLPLKGGKIEEFGFKTANARLTREYFKGRRKIEGMLEDVADRNLLRRQLQAEEKQLKVATGKDRNEKRLKEIKKQHEIINAQRDEHDNAYFDCENRNCYALLDTTIPFEKIDWDEADRREVNGGLNFFVHSSNDSSFNANS